MERKITNIKERILYFTDFKGFSKENFFEELQVTYGNFKGKAKNQALGSDVIERIIAKYPEINPEWLLTGQGSMLKNTEAAVSSPQPQENDKYIVALEKQIALLEKNISLLEKENAYLEQRLELAELKDKEAMALKIRKQRKEIDQKDEIINL